MPLFKSKQIGTLEELLLDQLYDLYDAEHRLVDALPNMIEAATSPPLRQAFEAHLMETRGHVSRIEQAFSLLGKDAKRETCDAMKGLIAEGDNAIGIQGDAAVKDAALIAAAQRVEHYEMAGYGAARSFAARTGHAEVADLLQQNLDEEGAADKRLTQIAESSVNVAASP